MSPLWLRRWVLMPVYLYRKTLSRITPPTCRFHPTCSAYCVEAVETRGILVGFLLTLWRLLRCHPLCRGGYDPVPSGRECPRESVPPKSPPSS